MQKSLPGMFNACPSFAVHSLVSHIVLFCLSEIAGLEAFQQRLSSDVDRNSKKALQVAQDWLYSY